MEIKDKLLDIPGINSSRFSLLELFIRRTAVVTSTPEHIVEKIVKSQWRNANKAVGPDSDISEIDFCNLGTFYMSGHKARKKLEKIHMFNEAMIREGKNGTGRSNEEILKTNGGMIDSIIKKMQLEQNDRP